MNHKFFTLCLLIAVVFTSGCFPKKKTVIQPSTELSDEIVVYFSKDSGNHSVTEGVLRQIPQDNENSSLLLAIEELLHGPNEEESILGYYSEIPKGTRLLGITEENGSTRINLSKQFVTGGGANSQQQRFEELRRTVFSIDKDGQVFIDIEGEQLSNLSGEGLEVSAPLNRDIQ